MLRWGIGSEFTSQCRGLASGPSVIRSGPDAKASESVPGPHLILCSDLRAGSRFMLPIPKVHLWELLLRILICNLGVTILHLACGCSDPASYIIQLHASPLSKSFGLVYGTYSTVVDTYGSSKRTEVRQTLKIESVELPCAT